MPAYQLLGVMKPFWLVQHAVFTCSWCLSATPQGVCQWQVHTHTHQTSLPLTPSTVSPSPCQTSHGPASLPLLGPPLLHLFPLSACADKQVSVHRGACARPSVRRKHTHFPPPWNMAVSSRSVYLDSSLQEETLVEADGRSTATNRPEKWRSNRSHRQHKEYCITFVEYTHTHLAEWNIAPSDQRFYLL